VLSLSKHSDTASPERAASSPDDPACAAWVRVIECPDNTTLEGSKR
jgi:hypothetical protein